MRLYIVRHGETDWNRAGLAQGHTDISLNETGLAQAACLADALPASVERVWSSDLVRCQQTIEPYIRRFDKPIDLDARLRERSFGEWEGRLFLEWYSLQDQDHDPLTVKPAGGENVLDVWDRFAEVEWHLRRTEQVTLVVTHGMAAGVLLARLLNGTPATSRSFRFGNTGITELERRSDGTFFIHRLNDLRHVPVPQAVAAR